MPGLAARARAADLVRAVLAQGKALDEAAERGPGDGEHAGADRALTHALAMAVLRRLPTLDAAITACLERPLPASAASAMAILRVMAAQLLVLEMADHAAVALAVEDAESRKDARKFKGLINAVGRRLIRERAQRPAEPLPTDLPPWLAGRWQRTYGEQTTARLALAMRDQPAIDLTVRRGTDRPALVAALADHAAQPIGTHSIRLTRPGGIERLPGYADGTWWIQDYAATLPAGMLLAALGVSFRPSVLDLCAAPGGKSAQLADAGCAVTALDQSAPRMRRFAENMKRLQMAVETRVCDAFAYTPDEAFDGVLLDAPCSATGTLRRNPDIGYLRSDEDIRQLAGLQERLLARAATMVRPGGVLVYATCSLEPEEGEAQVAAFLAAHPGWQIVPMVLPDAPEGSIRPDGTLRTLPFMTPPNDLQTAGPMQSPSTGMDGFFAAALRRVPR